MKIKFWDNIENADTAIMDSSKVLINDEKIFIHFVYPIGREVMIMFESKTGFTKRDIFNCVRIGYEQIYDNADFYEVWGHSIDDLYLEGCTYKKGVLRLSMGS